MTLSAIEGTDDVSAYYLMKSKGNRKLMDDHLWWSVFSRPVRSRFSRKQRVSLCMAMLMLNMLANCIFYETDGTRVTNPFFTIGFLSFDPVDVRSDCCIF